MFNIFKFAILLFLSCFELTEYTFFLVKLTKKENNILKKSIDKIDIVKGNSNCQKIIGGERECATAQRQ